MTITLNTDYDVTLNAALLGYVGETQARPVSVEGLTVDGADRYILTIDYGDGIQYEVDITGGQWTPTADILRSAQTVSCQIAAKKLSGQEYILVKKSRIFRLRIGAAIGDNAVPSPSVAVDALDRIDAIGRQAHADMQAAQTAAETATQAAENAAKSATNAGVSADTAEQAAERAETAQKSAETSATQAETAKQDAETARQQAVSAQNAAKTSADQASASAKQTAADKTATAGYAQTAKTAADSTAADRQAVTDMAAQVTADKATVAENTAKVATDRKATETAAQTAQAVADSLPDDYVTAVEKIAENTAEIGRVKLTDKELQRRVNALYDMGQGITHQFETDSDTAYQKAVPTGGKLMSVKRVGGRSIVFNQLIPDSIIHVTVTIDEDVTEEKWLKQIVADTSPIARAIGHKVLGKCIRNTSNPSTHIVVRFGNNNTNISNGYESEHNTEIGIYPLQPSIGNYAALYFRGFAGATAGTYGFTLQLFDLTAMFGSGNEPTTVEEFEAMFPAEYYPYNAAEIISAGTESVVEQGANLCDPTIFSTAYPDRIAVEDDIIDVFSGVQAMFESGVALKIPQGYSIAVFPIAKENAATTNGRIRALFSDGGSSDIAYITDANSKLKSPTTYIAKKDISAIAFNWSAFIGGFSFKMQITQNATDSFTPYHQTAHPIPEAIKSLPGYGWSAGTARNYIDYENKRYVQSVGSVDLGTLTWVVGKSGKVSFQTSQVTGQKLTKSYRVAPNIICSKYLVKTQDNLWGKTDVTGITADANADGFIYVNDTSFTDASTFKQAMQGVMLYYELAEPIVTDISDLIPDDFLRNIEVEAGGSVTFKNSNDSYRIPVPSEEEYIVKLSEIGGSV